MKLSLNVRVPQLSYKPASLYDYSELGIYLVINIEKLESEVT